MRVNLFIQCVLIKTLHGFYYSTFFKRRKKKMYLLLLYLKHFFLRKIIFSIRLHADASVHTFNYFNPLFFYIINVFLIILYLLNYLFIYLLNVRDKVLRQVVVY